MLSKNTDFFVSFKSAAIRSANYFGLMFGITNSIMFYAIGAAYYVGAYLVDREKFGLTKTTGFEKIQTVFSCIIFGAQSVGESWLYLNFV